MRWIRTGLILLLGLSAGAGAEAREGAPLYLERGEQRILAFPDLEHYTLSGSETVHYLRLPGSNSLLIKAMKPGLATLYVSTSANPSETHLIRVTAQKTATYPTALWQALNLIKTLEVIDGGERYFIRGSVGSVEEARALANLKERFPSFISDETTRSDADLAQASRKLKPLIAPYPGLTLETRAGTLSVQGAVTSATLRESLQKQIRAVDPLTTLELQSLKDLDPTLYFKVFLLEVKKELIMSLGMEWPPNHPASIHFDPAQFLVGDSIDLVIHALSNQGLVRVLSSPELVVKAPGQAELFAGKELPIHERSKYMDNVIWKNIGLSLKLDVKEYAGEKVRLLIETEMSHLDPVLTNENLPSVRTNRIKTLVDGTIGKPLLLSGLLQEDLRTNTTGIPFLSTLPIIGKLFGSEDYQNSRSEFVAILLPQRNVPLHPLERISKEIPKGYLPLPRNYLSEEEKSNLKKSPAYPWNVL